MCVCVIPLWYIGLLISDIFLWNLLGVTVVVIPHYAIMWSWTLLIIFDGYMYYIHLLSYYLICSLLHVLYTLVVLLPHMLISTCIIYTCCLITSYAHCYMYYIHLLSYYLICSLLHVLYTLVVLLPHMLIATCIIYTCCLITSLLIATCIIHSLLLPCLLSFLRDLHCQHFLSHQSLPSECTVQCKRNAIIKLNGLKTIFYSSPFVPSDLQDPHHLCLRHCLVGPTGVSVYEGIYFVFFKGFF